MALSRNPYSASIALEIRKQMSAPRGVFVGLTTVELAALKVTALARIANGDRTGMSGGAKSSQKQWTMSAEQMLIEIAYATNKANGTLGPRRTYFDVRDRTGYTTAIEG